MFHASRSPRPVPDPEWTVSSDGGSRAAEAKRPCADGEPLARVEIARVVADTPEASPSGRLGGDGSEAARLDGHVAALPAGDD